MEFYKKIKYKFWVYSKFIIFWVFGVCLCVYILLLKEISIYFTYVMIFLSGILVGYLFSDKAHKKLGNVSNN